MSEAFEQCANAMFHYMTEVDYIEMQQSYDIEVEGHDMMTLLYNFLDELLFLFSAEPNFIARVSIKFRFQNVTKLLQILYLLYVTNCLIFQFRKYK